VIDYGTEVDRILAGPPSKLAFRALCAALRHTDLVAECAERLAEWPDEVRAAPWSWLAALEAGHTTPAWPLVRSLALRPPHCGVTDATLPDPRSQPEVRGVTHLDLGWFAHESLAALVETMDRWENLRTIQTSHVSELDEEVVANIANHPALSRIESLNLMTSHEDMWHFEKPPFRPPAGRPLRLRHVGLRAPDLVHLMRSGQAPDLRSAEVLVCDTGEARELAACRELARLDRLAIGFRCGRNGRSPMGQPFFGNVIDEDDEACEAFFARADLASLRDLTVRGTRMGTGREGLGARGVHAIVASGVLRQLTELTLDLLPIGDATIVAVLGGIDAEHIEKLALTDLVATDVTAAAFAGAYPRLRHLDLSYNGLGPQGARRLAGVALPALEHLDLSGWPGGSPYYGRPALQPIGDAGAEALASPDNAPNLARLRLSATGLGVAGVAALMTSDRFDALDLSRNPVGSWPEKLASSPAWHTLRTLDVTECGLGDDDIEALASTPSAPDLHGISLAYNNIGSRGARALASWPVLPQLWELNLHDNVIGDDGLIDLANSQAARRLLELDLEQDCWNPNARPHSTPLPAEVVAGASFPNLDAIFLGMVDEYHGARYSSGFPAHVRETLATASTTRPELVAFLTHLDMDELEQDLQVSDDRDFRPNRPAYHAERLEEAQDFARRVMAGDIGWP
jgi:Leucine Rich repeat